jgi:gamma-glutamyl phosphate reductase
MAAAIRRDAAKLMAANAEDVRAARDGRPDAAFVDRLTLKRETIEAMAKASRTSSRSPTRSARSPSCATGPPASRSA